MVGGDSMREPLDSQSQPLNRRYNAARLSDRAIDELIGLSRGVIADGVVTQEEAEFLAQLRPRTFCS